MSRESRWNEIYSSSSPPSHRCARGREVEMDGMKKVENVFFLERMKLSSLSRRERKEEVEVGKIDVVDSSSSRVSDGGWKLRSTSIQFFS